MSFPEPRPPTTRKADTLALLARPVLDGWVASGAGDGAHLVPLSVHWTGERFVIAVERSSLTARNLDATGTTRIGLGATRDVVMVDATVEHAYPLADVPSEVAEGYAGQSDWDPRAASGDFVYLVLRPVRVQAWRQVNEIAGRTLMRDGAWVV